MSELYDTMPKTVKIGGYRFKIKAAGKNSSDIAGVMGTAQYISMLIRIRMGLKPLQLANTFIHEVIHAIHWNYGLNDDSHEEEFTNLTANGLCAFWQDNLLARQSGSSNLVGNGVIAQGELKCFREFTKRLNLY